MPMFAAGKAGVSFTPSPAVAIKRHPPCNYSIRSRVCCGRTPASNSLMPTFSVIAFAFLASLPVSMIICKTSLCSARSAFQILIALAAARATLRSRFSFPRRVARTKRRHRHRGRGTDRSVPEIKRMDEPRDFFSKTAWERRSYNPQSSHIRQGPVVRTDFRCNRQHPQMRIADFCR